MAINARKNQLSKCSLLHYIKLVYRSVLFLGAAVIYIINKIHNTGKTFGGYENSSLLLGMIWLVFAIEMFLRLFPSKMESMGCEKQFAKNYRPVSGGSVELQPIKRTAAVAFAWVLLNAILGVLYFTGIIDRGILFLTSLAYSVCDMICILFFCPFQTWFMKNKCCTTCRIYNWDYAMIFTPLVFIPDIYSWSILALALILMFVWEVRLHRHPERFSESSNDSLACANCQEKLCHHKKQLQGFLKKHGVRFSQKT